MSDKHIQINSSPFGTIFIIFLILKLCKVITWSWWWVTAPLWIPIIIIIFMFIILFLIYLIIGD